LSMALTCSSVFIIGIGVSLPLGELQEHEQCDDGHDGPHHRAAEDEVHPVLDCKVHLAFLRSFHQWSVSWSAAVTNDDKSTAATSSV
jgi:hypothetical protein